MKMPRVPFRKKARHPHAFEDKTFFLGLGPTKTGTTWLHYWLQDHPKFFATPMKETHFFSAIHHTGNRDRYRERSVRKLRSLLDDPKLLESPGTQALFREWTELLAFNGEVDRYVDYFRRRVGADQMAFGELSPSYCSLTEDGYRLIRSLHPRVRLMICLRDPVSRADAVLRHMWKHGNRMPYDRYFDRSLPIRLESHNFYYDKLLEPIFSVFDESELHVAFFERFFEQGELDTIADFIGIARRPGRFDERVAHSPPAERMTEAHRQRLLEELAPTYARLRAWFGDRIPSSWSA